MREITINKSSGGAGTSVTVTGAGFAANESDIAITYDGQDVGTKVIANATGAWSSTFIIPASPAGAHTISASGPTTAAVTAPFTSTASVLYRPPRTSGAVGSSINLTGSGFAAGETITITFDNNTQVGSAVAGDDGGLTATFIIPPSTFGPHTITVKGSSSSSNLSFKVTPFLSLDPASGFVGSTVKISGSGFAASSALKFTYDDNPIGNVGTVKTDANGSFHQADCNTDIGGRSAYYQNPGCSKQYFQR